jgi:hypothetical protein
MIDALREAGFDDRLEVVRATLCDERISSAARGPLNRTVALGLLLNSFPE